MTEASDWVGKRDTPPPDLIEPGKDEEQTNRRSHRGQYQRGMPYKSHGSPALAYASRINSLPGDQTTN